MFLSPRFESNPAYTAFEVRPLPGGVNQQVRRIEEFDFGLSASPRVWLAWESDNGIGARVRWWRYEGSDDLTTVNAPIVPGAPLIAARTITSASPLMAITPPTTFPAVNSVQILGVAAPPDVLRFDASLCLDVWDFEGTFGNLKLADWSLLLAGGVRYASISQEYRAELTGAVPQFLHSTQSYNGIGPLMSAEASRPLGTWGFGVYGVYRMAFLFGEHTHDVLGRTVGFIPPLALAINDDQASRNRFFPWFEVELGVEWARKMGRVEPFAQVGVQAQTLPLGSGASDYGNMGMIGCVMNAGVKF